MNIGVFGGTFNPIHNGELIVARQARLQENLDKVIFVPNGRPPHKKLDVLDKELRHELVSAAIASQQGFEASRLEVDRPGVSWTIDTLRELKKTLGSTARLNFIIGEDNVRSFEQYEHRQEFFKLCRLLVSPRQTPEQSNLDDWKARLPEAEIVLLNCIGNGISSTMIRSLIRNGQDYSQFVPAAVMQIIEAKGLYKTQFGMQDAA
jgi:nicotinate-nucleotide adenylyltransferase